MTEQQTPSKAELVELLRASGRTLLDTLRALPADRFEEGRYENGWNGRQILAHVAAIEWTYPRLLEIPTQPPPPSGELPTRTAQGGIDAYNARQVEKRADTNIADLLAEFEHNRAAMIAAVEAADESLFASPIRSAGGRTGPLGHVIREVAVDHVNGHARDIVGKT